MKTHIILAAMAMATPNAPPPAPPDFPLTDLILHYQERERPEHTARTHVFHHNGLRILCAKIERLAPICVLKPR